ncbi:MAG: glycosyltransferase family protein [Anaerolineaceae bacterium]|nr:glycosyltransferase family protein [Betaproteobacteria bacterium]
MKIIATIEARMTSSRLPGKVLLQAAGQPMLEHLVNRLRAVPSLDGIVLATTVNVTDDVLEEFSRHVGIGCYRGSEDDVMMRVIGAAESVGADVVVEITGDCPIIDPQIVEQTIRMFKAHQADYVSNAQIRSYPDGMDTQVFRLATLRRSAELTDEALDHEHVTLHIRNHPEIFSHVHLVAPPEIHWPELGLTLDELKDYELLKKVIEHFEPADSLFSCLDVVRLLRQRPDWVAINQAVVRKGAT